MTLTGTTKTYNTFDEVSESDKKVIEMVRKYSNGEKSRSFRSFKSFWRKYVGMVYVIGSGSYDDPQHCFSLIVNTPDYIGQADRIILFND